MVEIFEHTADLGLRIRAASLPELFAEAARGLTEVIVENADTIEPREVTEFTIPGRTYDLLLFDWLSRLLYEFEVGRRVFARFEATLTDLGLQVQAWGEPVDTARHILDHEVKAITYHELKVEPDGDGWLAEVIVDI